MQSLETDNKGYRYILTMIEIFSRYAWAIPVKSKRGDDIFNAFETIFRERKPDKIQFDEGKEFYNGTVKELPEKKGIEYFSTNSDKKVVERFNRTLKTRMWKYITEKNTRNWLPVFHKFVHSYNNSVHSSIGMTPIQASKEQNHNTVWWNLYGDTVIRTFGHTKYKPGQTVRISKYKSIFGNGYLPNFTEELFNVDEVVYGSPIVYKLEDLDGEEIKSILYEEELSEFSTNDATLCQVEKILRAKKMKGKTYAMVKWKGYSYKFNSWEPLENVQDIPSR